MEPTRTCIGCRTRRPAAELVRYVLDENGTVVRGLSLPGRGAWLCPERKCLEAAIRQSGFDRAFRTGLDTTATARLLDDFDTSQMDCGS